MQEISKQNIEIISELIKRVKASSGDEKKALLEEISSEFQISSDGKWLVSKLRMILLHLGASKESLILTETKSKKRIKQNQSKIMKSPNKGAKRQKTKPLKETKGKRTSLEEKQLQKLRSLKFKEVKRKNISTSKAEFYKSCGLEPLVIQLD